MPESPDESVEFFGAEERSEIEADFACTCILCKVLLAAGEGYFIPLMADHAMFNMAKEGLIHKVFKPFEAPNGLYLCQPCGRKWLNPLEDICPWAVLVLCVPLMIYAHNVIYLAEDEATRSQTLDEILADLEKYPRTTPPRRDASPFLHCYQLLPVLAQDEFTLPLPTLVVHPTLSTCVDYKRGSTTTHYRILKHNEGSVPSSTHPVHVPLYGQFEGGDIMLWHIPMRSHGLMFGYAERLFFQRVHGFDVRKVFNELLFMMLYHRRLPEDTRMPGTPSAYDVFRSPQTSGEAGSGITSQLNPIERDSSSGSDSTGSTGSTVEGEPSGSHGWSVLPFLVSALKRWV